MFGSVQCQPVKLWKQTYAGSQLHLNLLDTFKTSRRNENSSWYTVKFDDELLVLCMYSLCKCSTRSTLFLLHLGKLLHYFCSWTLSNHLTVCCSFRLSIECCILHINDHECHGAQMEDFVDWPYSQDILSRVLSLLVFFL